MRVKVSIPRLGRPNQLKDREIIRIHAHIGKTHRTLRRQICMDEVKRLLGGCLNEGRPRPEDVIYNDTRRSVIAHVHV